MHSEKTLRAIEAYKQTREHYRSLPMGEDRTRAFEDFREACESVAHNVYLDSICNAARGPYVTEGTRVVRAHEEHAR